MSIEHYPKLEVGMTVYVVWNQRRHGSNRELEIVKVGRKWAYTECREKIDMESWRLDGGNYSSPGTAYPSEQHYLEEQQLRTDWDEFVRSIERRSIPKDCTVERIKQAMELLGI